MEPHILLADANPEILKILGPALGREGYRVYFTTISALALVKATQFRPDLIVLDAVVPPHGARPLVEALRQNPALARTPIIVKVPRPVDRWAPLFKGAGASLVMERPLRFADLKKAIAAVLRSQGRQAHPVRPAEASADAGRLKDTAVLRSQEALLTAKLELLCRRAESLAAFPFVVARAMAISSDSDAGAFELATCIRSDPALTGKVLKIANTAQFAKRGGSIADPAQAVVRMGFTVTRKAVLAMPLVDMFPREGRARGASRVDFWLHSLAVACLASNVARQVAPTLAGDAFVAGLLHDLGKLILDECFEPIFSEILDAASNVGGRVLDAEKELIGVDHAQIGGAVLERWKVPEPVRNAVLYHHELARAQEKLSGPDLALARLVGASNLIVKALEIGGSGDLVLDKLPQEVWSGLGLPRGIMPTDMDAFYRELNMFRDFLKIGDEDIRPIKDTKARRKSVLLFAEEGQGVSLLELLLQAQGYVLVRPGETSGRMVDMVVVQDARPEKAREYAEIARQHAGKERVPLVMVSDDPVPVTPEDEAITASFPTAFDVRVFSAWLDEMLIGKALEPPPLIPAADLKAEKDGLVSELKGEKVQTPVSTASASTAATTSASTVKKALPGKSIMLVEDNAAIRMVLAKVLRTGGYRVVPMGTAIEALDMLEREKPDLFVLDIMMPGMDGLEFLQVLRQKPGYARTPVVMCTSVGDREKVLRAAKLGAAGYVVKPVRSEVLLGKIASALGT